MLKARKVPSEISPCRASQPPRASTATWPSAGTAWRAGLYRLVSRATRTREANRPRARCSSAASSRCSCPKPLTTRTPATAASTTEATSAASCCACQLAGNRSWRERTAISHSAGPTTRATSVRGSDNVAISTTDTTNINALPHMFGRNCNSIWMSVTSEMARLTTCPVGSSSCPGPSRRSSAARTSLRRSYCTPSDTRPEQYRRRNPPAKRTAPSPRSSSTHGVRCAVGTSTRSTTSRRTMGSAAVATAATRAAP